MPIHRCLRRSPIAHKLAGRAALRSATLWLATLACSTPQHSTSRAGGAQNAPQRPTSRAGEAQDAPQHSTSRAGEAQDAPQHPTSRAGEAQRVEASIDQLVTAFNARATRELTAHFTPDAQLTLIGDGGPVALAAPLARLLARFPDAHLHRGRSWIDPPRAVVELVFRGTATAGPLLGHDIPARPVSVAAAAVIAFAPDGRATTLRLYVDVATALGQLSPALLPAGADIRPLEPVPSPASHAAGTLAIAAASYRYTDFAAPRVLDKAETQQLVARFLTLVADFHVLRPFQLAANDDVITELSETAKLGDRPIALHALDLKHFAGDTVIAEWQYSNYVEILTQAGGMAPPNLTAP